MKSGHIIVMEGLDGSGKSTAAEEVARKLGAEHWDSLPAPYREHQGVFYKALDEHGWYLHMLGMLTVLKGNLTNHVEAGKSVVLPRYWYTTTAYYQAKCQYRGLEALPVHPLDLGLPSADVAVMISIDEAERRRRLAQRKQLSAEDDLTLDEKFVEALKAQYGRYSELRVLDANNKTPDEISNEVLALLGNGSTR